MVAFDINTFSQDTSFNYELACFNSLTFGSASSFIVLLFVYSIVMHYLIGIEFIRC